MSEQPKEHKKIYLAGSWKNQSTILLIRDILKSQGHELDCFASEDNGRISFCWAKLDDIQDKLPSMDAKDMLEVPRVQEAFKEDKKWLDWCNLVVLILPSGKSAHLEAGYAKGHGKTVVIFGDLQKGDFDVMYGFADGIFRSDEIDLMVDFVNDTRSRPSTAPARFPNSTQLIEMAHTDWKNREERKHNHDEQDWCAGWINGYLTPNKPSPAPSPNLCQSASWYDGYFLCKFHSECQHQEGKGLQPYCGRPDAIRARERLLKGGSG